MNNIGVKQKSFNDCGIACLVSVFHFHGIKTSIEVVKKKVKTNYKGTTLLQMKYAVNSFNLKAQGVYVSVHDIINIDKPFVAHLKLRFFCLKYNHFIVVYGLIGNKLRIMDPTYGVIHLISLKEFEEKFTGFALLIKNIQEK